MQRRNAAQRTPANNPKSTGELVGLAQRFGISVCLVDGRYEADLNPSWRAQASDVLKAVGFRYDKDIDVWWTFDRDVAAKVTPQPDRPGPLAAIKALLTGRELGAKPLDTAPPAKRHQNEDESSVSRRRFDEARAANRERLGDRDEDGEDQDEPAPGLRFRDDDDEDDVSRSLARVRLDPATREQLKAEAAAARWRKDNVQEVYLHRDLLWTPPICPRRKGGDKGKHDDRLLTPFEFAIACAVVSKARIAWREAMHQGAKLQGAKAIAEEQVTRREYFRDLTKHRNDPWLNKPHIGKVIKEVGHSEYQSELLRLNKNRKSFIKTVNINTSCWALLKAAGFDDSSESVARVAEAIERLTEPVLTLRGNTETDFPPLIRAARRKGSTMHLEVDCHWFRERAAKVVTPLPRKNPTALAIYLFAVVATDDDSNGIHFANFCKRLHLNLPPNELYRVLEAAEETLNAHLAKVGLPQVHMYSPTAGYLKIERREQA